MTTPPARGEVWWCETPAIGRRPVVVLPRDAVIRRHRRALVAPCTTTIRGLVSDVEPEPGEDPVPRRCVVNLDSVESVSVAVLVERLGRLADPRMRQVCAALARRGRLRGLTPARRGPCRDRNAAAMHVATAPNLRPRERQDRGQQRTRCSRACVGGGDGVADHSTRPATERWREEPPCEVTTAHRGTRKPRHPPGRR